MLRERRYMRVHEGTKSKARVCRDRMSAGVRNWVRSCRLIESTISASPLKSIPDSRLDEKIFLRREIELVELPVTGAGVCPVSVTDTEDLASGRTCWNRASQWVFGWWI